VKTIPPHILNLVVSYISKEISESDFIELKNWINQEPENKKLFSDYLYVYKKARGLNFVETIDTDLVWEEMLEKFKVPLNVEQVSSSESKRVIRLKNTSNIFKYAAIAVVFIGMAYWFQQTYFQNNTKNNAPVNQITLELENGELKNINGTADTNLIDGQGHVVGQQKGEQLVYSNAEAVESLVYNTLSIPYGKRFEIVLSDGTKVHLNAGSSLKYPVRFLKGQDRKVFLTGEGYFDVAKDAEHPFIVQANAMDVRVLGTQFNISSYPEDENINTVLVEGAVSIYTEGEVYSPETATALQPGFKAEWRKSDKKIAIAAADIEMATAWISGRIIFRRTSFNEIIKKLERHYDVTIINNNKVLGEQQFAASFDVETIEEVLQSFNANFQIDYRIEKNKIFIEN